MRSRRRSTAGSLRRRRAGSGRRRSPPPRPRLACGSSWRGCVSRIRVNVFVIESPDFSNRFTSSHRHVLQIAPHLEHALRVRLEDLDHNLGVREAVQHPRAQELAGARDVHDGARAEKHVARAVKVVAVAGLAAQHPAQDMLDVDPVERVDDPQVGVRGALQTPDFLSSFAVALCEKNSVRRLCSHHRLSVRCGCSTRSARIASKLRE